jgi:hypothetical protein
MQADKSENCEKCNYSLQTAASGGIVGQKPLLVCNRFPPTIKLLVDSKGNIAMHLAFPTVNPDMVCGEFEVFL